MLAELLQNPKHFFCELSRNEPCLKYPALIVLVMAVLGSITGYMMGELSGKLFSGIMEGLAMIAAVSAAVTTFISSFIIWVIAAVILFGLQKVMQGTGTFKRVLEVTSYGMIPLVVSSFVGLVLAFYYIPQAVITPIRTTNPDEISRAAMQMMSDPALAEWTMVSTALSVILLIWVANLWSIGLESTCGLEPKKALIVAGLPVVLYIAYVLSNLLLFTGA